MTTIYTRDTLLALENKSRLVAEGLRRLGMSEPTNIQLSMIADIMAELRACAVLAADPQVDQAVVAERLAEMIGCTYKAPEPTEGDDHES